MVCTAFLKSNCRLCEHDFNLENGLVCYIKFHIIEKINMVQNWT